MYIPHQEKESEIRISYWLGFLCLERHNCPFHFSWFFDKWMMECLSCHAISGYLSPEDTCITKEITEYFVSRSSVEYTKQVKEVEFLSCSSLRRELIPLIHLVLRMSAAGSLQWAVFLLKNVLAINIHVAGFCAVWRAEDILMSLFCKALFRREKSSLYFAA